MDKKVLKTLVIDKSSINIELFRSYLAEAERVEIISMFLDFNSAYSFLLENSCDLVFLDIDDVVENDLLNTIEHLKNINSYMKIVVTSHKQDVALFIKLMRLGICDFLLKPLIKHNLLEIINKLNNKKNACESSTVISVCSGKGGTGKTTVAVNLASELSKFVERKVLLLDVNFEQSDAAIFLNLQPKIEFFKLLKNIQNIREEYLNIFCMQYKNSRLYLLAETAILNSMQNVYVSQFEKLLTELKKIFDYIVIDTSVNYSQLNKKIFLMSDDIFLIGNSNLPSLRDYQKNIEILENNNIESYKIKLLLNRYVETDDIKIADIEKILNKKIFWKIPNNYLMTISAINKGVVLSELNSESNIAKNFRDLASLVTELHVK